MFPKIVSGTLKKTFDKNLWSDRFKVDMKLLTPFINMFAECILNSFEWLRFRKKEPSLLAYSVGIFTNESWLETIQRQKRLFEYLYYYNTVDSSENSANLIKDA